MKRTKWKTEMDPYYLSLAVFMLVVFVNILGLFFDLWLVAIGCPTISQLVKNGWYTIGAAIVAWQLLGAAAIAAHFLVCKPI